MTVSATSCPHYNLVRCCNGFLSRMSYHLSIALKNLKVLVVLSCLELSFVLSDFHDKERKSVIGERNYKWTDDVVRKVFQFRLQ